MIHRTALAAFVLLAGSAAAASGQLVTNGGFETGSFSGWTAFGDQTFNGVAAVPHTGSFGAYFGTIGTVSGISQTIATVAGTNYTFSFWFDPSGASGSSIEADWNGSPVFSLANGPDDPYTLESFTEMATGPTTTIGFGFRDDHAFSFLDDVSVTPLGSVTPEPASLSLVATGLVGMAAAGLRRRRRA